MPSNFSGTLIWDLGTCADNFGSIDMPMKDHIGSLDEHMFLCAAEPLLQKTRCQVMLLIAVGGLQGWAALH